MSHEAANLEADAFQTREKLVIDVTAFCSVPRITGIQQVLRSISASEQVQFVRYSESAGCYEELPGLPDLTRREPQNLLSPVLALLRVIGLAVWSLLEDLLSRFLGVRVISGIKARLMRVYSNWFSIVTFSTSPSGPLIPNEEAGFVWLLDVPNSPSHLDFLAAWAAKPGFDLGVYVYDLIPLLPSKTGGEQNRFARELFRSYLTLVGNADVVVCLSRDTRRDLETYCRSQSVSITGRLSVLYPPLFHRMEALCSRVESIKRGAVSESAGSARTLLVTAPFSKRKNLYTILRALLDVFKSGALSKAVFVVPSLTEVDWRAVRVAALLKARFPARIHFKSGLSEEQFLSLFSQADVVAVPSIKEGFGIPVVEGFAANCRVLASDIEVFRELAEHLPLDLVSPLDASEWARAISAAKPNNQSRARVLGSLSNVVSRPEDFIRELRLLSHHR